MKILSIVCFFLFFCSFYSQNQSDNPPGTLAINQKLFIDQNPVSNLMFVEYLKSKEILSKNGFTSFSEFTNNEDTKKLKEEMKILNFPSPLLIRLYNKHEMLQKNKYATDQRFMNSPVLEIPKQEAEKYCQWRSEVVNHNIYKHSHQPQQDGKKVLYRLPTLNELEVAHVYFLEENRSTIFKKSLFKIKKNEPTNNFTIFPISEVNRDNTLFNDESNNSYKGFKCICEIKEM